MNILSDLCFGRAYTYGHSLRNKQTLFKEPIVNPRMIHVDVWQKTTKFGKASILHLKNKYFFKKRTNWFEDF